MCCYKELDNIEQKEPTWRPKVLSFDYFLYFSSLFLHVPHFYSPQSRLFSSRIHLTPSSLTPFSAPPLPSPTPFPHPLSLSLFPSLSLPPSTPLQLIASSTVQTNANGPISALVEGPKMLLMSHDELVFSSKPGAILRVRYSTL
jgi:hypothetical protein